MARIRPDLACRDTWESRLRGAVGWGREEAKAWVNAGCRLGGLPGLSALPLPQAAKRIRSSAWSEDRWEQLDLLKAVSGDKK